MSLPASQVETRALPSNWTNKTYNGKWWLKPGGKIRSYIKQSTKEFQSVIEDDAVSGNATIVCTYDETGNRVDVQANCFNDAGTSTTYVLGPGIRNLSINGEGEGRIQSNLPRPGGSRPLIFMKGYDLSNLDGDRVAIDAELYVEAKGDLDSRVSTQDVMTYIRQ